MIATISKQGQNVTITPNGNSVTISPYFADLATHISNSLASYIGTTILGFGNVEAQLFYPISEYSTLTYDKNAQLVFNPVDLTCIPAASSINGFPLSQS